MSQMQTTIIPHTQEPYVTRTYPSPDELGVAIEASAKSQKEWAKVPLTERIGIGRRFIEEFEKMSNDMAKELTIQMGRCGLSCCSPAPTRSPVLTEAENPGQSSRHLGRLGACSGELITFSPSHRMLLRTSRSRNLINLVSVGLFGEPLLVLLLLLHHGSEHRAQIYAITLIACSYPYLTMINSVLPSLLAGNSVLLKPSPQTPVRCPLPPRTPLILLQGHSRTVGRSLYESWPPKGCCTSAPLIS